MRRGLGLALALGLAGPAGACPTGEDAARAGVTVTYDDGSVSHYRRDADGVVTEESLFDDPEIDGYRVHALYGLYVLEEYDLIGGAADVVTRERQSFADGLKALPRPAPGLAWQGMAEVTMEGLAPFPREVTVTMGAPATVRYGACSYESWPAELRHRDEADEYTVTLDYLPALGIAVFRAYSGTDGGTDSFTPLSIEARMP
jgi:hypothetical protein